LLGGLPGLKGVNEMLQCPVPGIQELGHGSGIEPGLYWKDVEIGTYLTQ
jgi:hypothetical protein